MDKDAIYESAGPDASFASLDQALGYKLDPADAADGLGAWYAAIAKTPVAKLSEEDLAIALRQKVHTPATLRAALTLLERDPWAGYQFPSELAAALGEVPPQVWRRHAALRPRAQKVATGLLNAMPPEDLSPVTAKALYDVCRAVLASIEAASAKRLVLQVANGPRVVQEDEEQLVIGSGPKAALYVRELEREHALVRRSGDGFEIVSISGEVMLNGRVVTVAPVKPGDRIELGTVRVQLGVEP
jgi:hypothetical protein